jgi:hypothetical protein
MRGAPGFAVTAAAEAAVNMYRQQSWDKLGLSEQDLSFCRCVRNCAFHSIGFVAWQRCTSRHLQEQLYNVDDVLGSLSYCAAGLMQPSVLWLGCIAHAV